jgi:hypothetical protein
MSYFRNLLQALVAQAAIYGGRVSEFPIGMSDQLDAAISDLKSVRYV